MKLDLYGGCGLAEKTKCELCKWSKYQLSTGFICLCLFIFPIGIPILMWVLYTKIFKVNWSCQHIMIDELKDENDGLDCEFYLSPKEC